MKRLIVIVLCFIICVVFFGCSSPDQQELNQISESTTKVSDKPSRTEAIELAKQKVTLDIGRKSYIHSYKYLEYATVETEERYSSWEIKLSGNFMAYDEYGTPAGTYIFSYDIIVPGITEGKWTVLNSYIRSKYE